VIAGVILAAGKSSRLGRPKQLLALGDRTVLQHVVDAAGEADLDDIVVVLGHRASEVEASLRLPAPARVVVNPEYGSGQTSSLRTGLRALGAETRAAIVLLGDQPGVAPEAIRTVAAAYRRTDGPVVQASYGGRPGHPVLLDRRVWPEVQAVPGDVGARDLLASHPEWVVPAEVPGDPPPDLDTWEDYRRLGGED
jgi:molybdenum cofactor cytidylyltransferase